MVRHGCTHTHVDTHTQDRKTERTEGKEAGTSFRFLRNKKSLQPVFSISETSPVECKVTFEQFQIQRWVTQKWLDSSEKSFHLSTVTGQVQKIDGPGMTLKAEVLQFTLKQRLRSLRSISPSFLVRRSRIRRKQTTDSMSAYTNHQLKF